MSWKKLTIDDLRLSLSEDEIQRLQNVSIVDEKIDTILQDSLDCAADAYRAAWQAKGYDIDPRDHYISTGYKQFILAFARYSIWTRFPLADNYALSEPRQKEYDNAFSMLKDPYLAVDKVSWGSSELSDYTYSEGTGSFYVPFQRFGDDPAVYINSKYSWNW